MVQDEQPRRPAAKVVDGCFAAVARQFMSPANPRWMKYSEGTRKLWGRELQFASRPDTLGNYSVKMLRPALVQGYLDGLAETPAKQVSALAAIRALEKWARVRDILPHSICDGCEAEGSDGGHIPWNDEQVALGECEAQPHLSRVITMAVNTGQRGSDLVKMRTTDIEVHRGVLGIAVVQQKTKRPVWVPFTPELSAAMERWERRPGFLLLDKHGMPWGTRERVSDAWMYERDHNAALAPLRREALGPDATEGLVIHGLRATACVRLLRAGANTRQIADYIGMSEQNVRRYTRFSDQRDNAIAALGHLNRTGRQPAEIVPFKTKA